MRDEFHGYLWHASDSDQYPLLPLYPAVLRALLEVGQLLPMSLEELEWSQVYFDNNTPEFKIVSLVALVASLEEDMSRDHPCP